MIIHITASSCTRILIHFSLGENEVPQLHPVSAFGFAMTSNPYLIISDLKSIVDPLMKSMVTSSTMT
jgi:hypothetical protein